MTAARLLLACLLPAAIVGCSTVNVTARQFVPRDAGKLSHLLQQAPAYQVDNIEFRHPSGAISRGVFVHQPQAQFTVLYFMGSGVRVDADGAQFAKPFTALNANVISFDYHDFGRSEAPPGSITLADLERETLALYDHVRGRTNGKLVVHGHSFGSFIAARLASQRRLDALVLEGTGTSARAYAEDQIPWFAKPFVRINLDAEMQAIDNRSALRSYQGPLLIMNGERDVQTPLATARALYDSVDNPRKHMLVVADAGHMSAMTKPAALEAYRALLAE